MLRRISKLSRRLGKKKDKQLSSSRSDLSLGPSKFYDTISEARSSLPNLCDEDSTTHEDSNFDNDKTIDACNNDCGLTISLPLSVMNAENGNGTTRESEEVMAFSIEELKTIYVTKHADEDRLFREEMKGLSSYVKKNSLSCEYAKLPQNKDKNRYKNIVTYDKSRVTLKRIDDDPFSDYINASYIDSYETKRKFIATQGPKPNTVNDFWRLVWEQGCFVIVMIADFRENGKQKCEPYFSEDGLKEYGSITVESEPATRYGSYQQRLLVVRHTDDEIPRRIIHLQCKRWPDHGVPKTTSDIFRLYKRVNEVQPNDCEAPILIHCSAGVGRTGTMIGLDILTKQLDSENKVNVHEAVIQMRKHRTEMVQSMDQYVLLHKLILEKYYFGDTDFDIAAFEEQISEMNSELEDGKTEYETQFELLSLFPPQNPRFGSGSLVQNAHINRDDKIIPYEHSQVFIRMRPTEMRPPYVNASTLQGYDDTVQLIAAQDPLPNSVEDFWRIVIDNNVTCIVMLTPQSEDDVEYCTQYWPTSDVMELGDISIKHEDTTESGEFVETKLTLQTDSREKEGRSITHLHYAKWKETEKPPPQAGAAILELVARVDRHKQTEEESGTMNNSNKILVHCSDGAGRTGVFCTIVNLVQRLKCENKVDIFRAVKDLRDCRPCMVKTLDQYIFCHEIIATYLQSFDLYSNGR